MHRQEYGQPERARTLVGSLEQQKRELDGSPPLAVDGETLAAGRHAMIKAIASAGRMLVSLENAGRIRKSPDA